MSNSVIGNWDLLRMKLEKLLEVTELPFDQVRSSSYNKLVSANRVLQELKKPKRKRTVTNLRQLCGEPEKFGKRWGKLLKDVSP